MKPGDDVVLVLLHHCSLLLQEQLERPTATQTRDIVVQGVSRLPQTGALSIYGFGILLKGTSTVL